MKLLEKRHLEVIPSQGKDAFEKITTGELNLEYETLVFFSADGRHNPRDVGRLLLALERGNDMVVASRFIQGGFRHDRNQRLRYRSIGNRIFTLLGNIFFYGNFSDSLYSFRAIRRKRLMEARLDEKGLPGFYQLSIQAIKGKWKVAEIPTVELVNPDVDDRKKILLSLFPLTRVLIKEWWRSQKGKIQAS